MAPAKSAGFALPIGNKAIAIILIIAAGALWLMLSNMPPVPREQPKVVKINATAAAPPPQPQEKPQPVAGLFMCRGEAYRTKSGITICGVEMVTEQYVFLSRGWIYAPNSTQFVVMGDVSACRLSVGVNTLYLNCTSPVMVVRQ
jgi:hypothetical protein